MNHVYGRKKIFFSTRCTLAPEKKNVRRDSSGMKRIMTSHITPKSMLGTCIFESFKGVEAAEIADFFACSSTNG